MTEREDNIESGSEFTIAEIVKSKRPMWQFVVLAVFFIFGGFLAMPCLCPDGAIKGQFTLLLFLMTLGRLAFGVYRNNLSKTDFAIWICVFIVFCSVVEMI